MDLGYVIIAAVFLVVLIVLAKLFSRRSRDDERRVFCEEAPARHHSITPVACSNTDCGMVIPSVLVNLAFIVPSGQGSLAA